MEFHPPAGTATDEVAAALRDVLTLRSSPERGSERSYYDTFDGLLREHELVLCHHSGELILARADGVGTLAAARMPRPRRPLLVTALPEGELREAVATVIGVRALLAQARVQCRERNLDVLDDERKTVVRLVLHLFSVAGATLPVRIAMTGLRGYEDELREVGRVLTDELLCVPVTQSLVDEAVAASGGRPGGVSGKPVVAMEHDQSAASAVSAVLLAQLRVIEANLPGALDDIDTEFLHDLRVAVRRSRAVQRECRDVFGAEGLAHFRAEFRWLQQATGDARDLDVYLLGYEELRGMVAPGLRGDLDPLFDVLRARHRRAHAAMRRALRSQRAGALFASWPEFLVSLDGPAAPSPIGEVAGARIRKVYRRMVRMGSAIGPQSPAEDYHELRKKGKELRYLLELFGTPLYPSDVVKPLIKTLKGLQDVLGRHQDREVQAATLRALSPEIASGPAGVGALMAVGALIQRLAQDEQAARAQFAESFAPFAARDQRRLVKETFH